MDTKSIFKSKTLWVNVIAIVMAVLADVSSVLSADKSITLLGILNIGLRAVTKTGVTLK